MKCTNYAALISSLLALVVAESPCNKLTTEYGSVCVCNSTYCDTVPPLEYLKSGEYQLYTTSEKNLGFKSTKATFSNSTQKADASVTVTDITKTHQSILGFGGAFTDATGINIASLSSSAQELLVQSYFGSEGLEYSLGRVPIGGTDFSIEMYTYCDEKDESLDSFVLQEADFKYKIAFIQKAIELRGSENINFVAAAWSAPTWMKNVDRYNKNGVVRSEYNDLWAKYYIKFFDAYKENNITFWAVSTQNEPANGFISSDVPNNGFSASAMKEWIKNHIGPSIRNSSHDVKIMLHDDQRLFLPLLLPVLHDKEVLEFADGVALHWYTDFVVPNSLLNLIPKNEEKPLFRLSTEACTGYFNKYGIDKAVKLGSWSRADSYLNSIFGDLEYDVIGWMDWNMALNMSGGPCWIRNEVDSPIIVNSEKDEFYKQPMFYALGHFSKFIIRDSVRVDAKTSGKEVSALAFVRPDQKIAVVIRNKSKSAKTTKVNILGSTEIVTIEANSINTLLYST